VASILASKPRAMCCGGCQAVAQAIVANGLADYYRNRDQLPNAPREALPAMVEGLQLYDHADFQKSFVRVLPALATLAAKTPRARSVADPRGDHLFGVHLAQRAASFAACRGDRGRHQLRDAACPGSLGRAAHQALRHSGGDRRDRLSRHPYDPAKSEELAGKERRARCGGCSLPVSA
jgi:Cu2+-exporting ATPase